jgi:hypothetical protein
LAERHHRLAAPIEDLERIVKRHFSRSALRRIRLARRDDAIRQLGAQLLGRGRACSGSELAEIIAQLLRRGTGVAR